MSNLHGIDRKLDYIKIEKNLTTQLNNYITNANLKTCVIGVSGGIDSAVVSTLAAKTGLSVILLTMPIHQNRDEIIRADEHITQLQKKYINVIHQAIDLTQSYEIMKQTFISNLKQSEQELYMALVNTRSRLRMTTLYAVAQTNK
jgi:NAD+ synthase